MVAEAPLQSLLCHLVVGDLGRQRSQLRHVQRSLESCGSRRVRRRHRPLRGWWAIEAEGGGGLVDPGASDCLGHDLGGAAVVVEDDEGFVGGASAGERDVDAASVGGTVEVEEGAVDGAALGGVAGLGVGQLDVGGDVVGGQGDPAGRAGDGEAAVAVGRSSMVQWSRFLTMRPRSVRSVLSLRRVATRSPT